MKNDLRRQQIDRMFEAYRPKKIRGWVKDIREALGLSMDDLAKRMGVIRQRVSKLEQDEISGKTTIESLERAANAMECELVYYFVPRRPLEEILREQAYRAAEKIVMEVDTAMAIEDQRTSMRSKAQLIKKTAEELILKNDRSIWKA